MESLGSECLMQLLLLFKFFVFLEPKKEMRERKVGKGEIYIFLLLQCRFGLGSLDALNSEM